MDDPFIIKFAQPGWPPDDDPISYPFPSTIPPDSPLEGLSPRLAELARHDAEGCRRLLATKWPVIAQPGLAAIRDRLLACRPVAVEIHGDVAILKLEGEHKLPVYLGDPAIVGAELDEQLAAFGLSGQASLKGFCECFPGLADGPPGLSGHFVAPADWERFEGFGWPITVEDEAWSQSLVVFIAPNGDLLLVSESGVAWAVMATTGPRIRRICDTFDEFLGLHAEHLTGGSHLDSWSSAPVGPSQ